MPFYATKQKSLEKSSAFAKRLLDNSPALTEFQYREQAEKLLTATIDRFPELFLKKGNAFPLYEALQHLFTDLPADYENDKDLTDDTAHFWYLFLREHFPKETTAMKRRKISMDYWLDFDDFAGSFDWDDPSF